MNTVATITKYNSQEIIVTTQSNKIFNIDIIKDNKNLFHSEVVEVNTGHIYNKISESTSNECFKNTIKWINKKIYNDTIIKINHSGENIFISIKNSQKIINDLKINITIKQC